MAYANHYESSQPGHAVRTWTMAEYLADHPPTPVFPPTSDAAAKIVAIMLWVLIAAGLVYLGLRASGVIG